MSSLAVTCNFKVAGSRKAASNGSLPNELNTVSDADIISPSATGDVASWAKSIVRASSLTLSLISDWA